MPAPKSRGAYEPVPCQETSPKRISEEPNKNKPLPKCPSKESTLWIGNDPLHNLHSSLNLEGKDRPIQSPEQESSRRKPAKGRYRPKRFWHFTTSARRERLPNEARSGSSRGSNLVRQYWWPELLASLLMLAVLVALVVTITKEEGHYLSQWSFPLSLNTIIAIYTIILRTAAAFILSEGLGQLKWTWFRSSRSLADFSTFDKASRGPWGALNLMLSTHWSGVLAFAGSLLVVVTLISDPFAQQLIRYDQCVANNNSAVTVARAKFYSQQGAHMGAHEAYLQADMEQAVTDGAFGEDREFTVMPFCPSGNCDFDPFYTLGFCASCEDLSDKVQHMDVLTATRVTEHIQDDNIHLISSVSDSSTTMYSTTATTQLLTSTTTWAALQTAPASNNSIGSYYTFEDRPTQVGFMPVIQSDPTWMQILPSDGRTFTVVAGFFDEKFPWCTATNPNADGAFACQGKGAANCTLSPCIKKIAVSSSYEFVQEQMLGSFDLDAAGHTLARRDCLADKNNESAISFGTPLPYDDGGWIGFMNSFYGAANVVQPYNASGTGLGPNITLDPECVFGMTALDIEAFQEYFKVFLNGSLTRNGATGAGGSPYDPALAQNAASPLLDNLFGSGNLTIYTVNGTFSSIANSLTAMLRRYADPGPYSAPAIGTMYYADTCIYVRFGWLAYPTALTVMTISFLVSVMVDSSRHGKGSWKTSILPVLFHGLHAPPTDESDSLTTNSAMRKTARGVRVQLRETKQGWKLV